MISRVVSPHRSRSAFALAQGWHWPSPHGSAVSTDCPSQRSHAWGHPSRSAHSRSLGLKAVTHLCLRASALGVSTDCPLSQRSHAWGHPSRSPPIRARSGSRLCTVLRRHRLSRRTVLNDLTRGLKSVAPHSRSLRLKAVTHLCLRASRRSVPRRTVRLVNDLALVSPRSRSALLARAQGCHTPVPSRLSALGCLDGLSLSQWFRCNSAPVR